MRNAKAQMLLAPRGDKNECYCGDERVAVFIDGANLYMPPARWADIDYRRLLTSFKQRCRDSGYYYTA
jgi:hypothetical protein